MTTQSRKHRGYRSQKVFADYIKGMFPYAEPTGAGRQGKDILSTPGISFELKARAGLNPNADLKQAESAATENELAVLVCRMNGQGEKSIGEWIAMVRVDTLLELLREAGYGTLSQDEEG